MNSPNKTNETKTNKLRYSVSVYLEFFNYTGLFHHVYPTDNSIKIPEWTLPEARKTLFALEESQQKYSSPRNEQLPGSPRRLNLDKESFSVRDPPRPPADFQRVMANKWVFFVGDSNTRKLLASLCSGFNMLKKDICEFTSLSLS